MRGFNPLYHEEMFKGPQSEGLRFPVHAPGGSLSLQEGQRAAGFLVHQPGQLSRLRPDDLSRKRVRLKRPFKHGVERFGFCGATDEKRDLSGVIEKNRSDGDPGRLKFFDPGSGNEPARFMYGPAAREQGRGMSVRSHAQQDQVETRDVRFGGLELFTQRGFILVGSGLGIGEFTRHAMNLRRGNGQVAKECFMGHSVITVRMIRRDVTFVSPEKPDSRPIQLIPERRGGEHRIEAFWG